MNFNHTRRIFDASFFKTLVVVVVLLLGIQERCTEGESTAMTRDMMCWLRCDARSRFRNRPFFVGDKPPRFVWTDGRSLLFISTMRGTVGFWFLQPLSISHSLLCSDATGRKQKIADRPWHVHRVLPREHSLSRHKTWSGNR